MSVKNNKKKPNPELRWWTVTCIERQKFSVQAASRSEAINNASCTMGAHTTTVDAEWANLAHEQDYGSKNHQQRA